jgi:ribosomal protein S27E
MTKIIFTLETVLLGGPGLDGYASTAAVYCVDCGEAIIYEVFKDYPNGIAYPECFDSETLPQPIFFGESDTAQYCDKCGEYLYGPQD